MAPWDAEARAPGVAGADLWLAEAAIPCRPGHASISRNDLSESLFIQTRGVLKKALMAQLRTTRQMRQAKGGTTKHQIARLTACERCTAITAAKTAC